MRESHRHEPLVALGVSALARAFARGDASPGDACEVYLERIARHDPAIGAFVTVDQARARHDASESARRWALGTPRSSIDGVPIGIKANIAVRGLPWTGGIGAWRHRIATEDADCVDRLREAGAVILGTNNMDAGALGAMTDNPWFGRTHNPHDLGRSAGGSSGGGAAAVAAGLCAAALGTDTMGSVRIPAAACGVFGALPSAHAIDRRGIVPLAPSFDRVGILARSLDDVRALLDVFGCGTTDRCGEDDRPLAIVILDDRHPVDATVRKAHDALRACIESAGWAVKTSELGGYDGDRVADRLLRLVEVEGAQVHRERLDHDAEALGAQLSALLRWGAALSPERRAEAAASVSSAAAAVLAALEGHAALLSPTVPHPAVAFDTDAPRFTARYTAMASITDLPAVAIPLGFGDGGLPQSLQLIGRRMGATLGLAERIRDGMPPVLPPSAFRW